MLLPADTTSPAAMQAQLANAQYNAANAMYNPASAAAIEVLRTSNPSLYLQATTNPTRIDAADAANEAAKHEAAFSQPRNDLLVQHSDAFNALVKQAELQKYSSLSDAGRVYHPEYKETEGKYYDTSTAAGIAAMLAGSGGYVNPYLASTAISEGYKGSISVPVNSITGALDLGRSTVPIPATVTQQPTFIPAGSSSLGETVTSYVPYGSYTQERLDNTKVLLDRVTGEVGIYGPVYSRGALRGFALESSGGRAALQSGMFTINAPETPNVVERGDVGNYALPSGANLSRLGAETYGGYVTGLDSRTIQSTGAKLGTYENVNNLANFVDAQGVNLSKAQAPGAAVPWSIATTSPALQYMNENGIVPGSSITPSSVNITKSTTQTSEIAPGVYLTGLVTSMGTPAASEASKYIYRTDPAAVIMEGALYLGDALTFGLWKPGSALLTEKGRNANPALDSFNRDISGLQSGSTNQAALGQKIESQKSEISSYLSGKINDNGQFTGTAGEYTKYKDMLSNLNSNVETYNQFSAKQQDVLSKGYASGAIIPINGGYTVNPNNVKEYGAFSDWNKGAGQWIQSALGQKPASESQFLAYEQTPEFKNANPVLQYGEGAYKILATNPSSIVASVLQGVEMYAGMGLLSGGFGTLAASSNPVLGSAGTAARNVLNSGIFQYGLGTALVASTAYEATGGFTLPVSQSLSNLGGASVNLAAMGWGGLAPGAASGRSSISLSSETLNRMAGEPGRTFNVETTQSPATRNILDKIDDAVYGVRQRMAGIENIGVGGGSEARSYDRSYAQYAQPRGAPTIDTFRMLYGPESMTIGLPESRPIVKLNNGGFYDLNVLQNTGKQMTQNEAIEYIKSNELGKTMRMTHGGITYNIPTQILANAYEAKTGIPINIVGEQARYLKFTQQLNMPGYGQELKPQPETIDLRETIDLSGKPYKAAMAPLELRTSFEIPTELEFMRPSNIATPAEQAMIIAQYGLSPEEIKLAKLTGASLNDILENRNLMTGDMNIAMPESIMSAKQEYSTMFAPMKELTILNASPMEKDYSRSVESIQNAKVIDLSYVSPMNAISMDMMLDQMVSPLSMTVSNAKQDYSRAFDVVTDVFTVQQPKQDYARTLATFSLSAVALDTKQDYARTFDVIPDVFTVQQPKQTTEQTGYNPWPEITPREQPNKIPFAFPWGGLGGSGGGGGGNRKKSIKFREILPTITPIEEMGGFRAAGKSFFRAIGNQQILEVKPQQRERIYDVDVDVDTRDLKRQQETTGNRVSDLAGMEFYRTATKQEKVKTGKPIIKYTPSQQEIDMAKMVGFSSSKLRKGRKNPWF